jgi:hypothetical protein
VGFGSGLAAAKPHFSHLLGSCCPPRRNAPEATWGELPFRGQRCFQLVMEDIYRVLCGRSIARRRVYPAISLHEGGEMDGSYLRAFNLGRRKRWSWCLVYGCLFCSRGFLRGRRWQRRRGCSRKASMGSFGCCREELSIFPGQ